MSQVRSDMSVKEILDTWPQTLLVFRSHGFEQFADAKTVDTVGRFLKLDTLLKQKQFDTATFIARLEEIIAEKDDSADISLTHDKHAAGDIRVAGLLPCPVRIPITEKFHAHAQDFEKNSGLKVSYQLEAASVGAHWFANNIDTAKGVDSLPDIFLSAGFEMFFDKKAIGEWKRNKHFVDTTSATVNTAFDSIQIKDPDGDYSIVAVVAAVFVIHKENYPDLAIPRTWGDILKPEYEKKVALPVSDFDLFNGMLLTIHKEFGDDGVRSLARSMIANLHPAQMVKAAKQQRTHKPFVTIMPYFFTKMVRNSTRSEVVWPEDGAIISPVFMLVKREKAELLKPLTDALAGKEIGEILGINGLFPSLNPEVQNDLPASAPWKWIGWDYIYQHDISDLIAKTNQVFEAECQKEPIV